MWKPQRLSKLASSQKALGLEQERKHLVSAQEPFKTFQLLLKVAALFPEPPSIQPPPADFRHTHQLPPSSEDAHESCLSERWEDLDLPAQVLGDLTAGY